MKKILIIEDEEITAFALEEFIISIGYEVISCVNNAKDAIQIAKSNHIDLIISDIMIKGNISGCEVCLEIKKSLDISIIFLSAFFDKDIFEYAKKSNPFAYLIKPYKEEELEATIKLAFHNKTIVKNKNASNIIEIDNYTFDLSKAELYYESSHIKLSRKSIIFLQLLCKNPGITISYETIISNMYETRNLNTLDNLRHIVKRLKNKLNITCIKSNKNIGYFIEI
jgi:DNA-binding response OmpR family regulator